MKPICVVLFDNERLRRSLLASFLQSTGCYCVVSQHDLCPESARAVNVAGLDGAILVVGKVSRTEHEVGEALRLLLGARAIVVCTVNDAAWKSLRHLAAGGAAGKTWRPDLCVGATCNSAHLLQCLNKLFFPARTVNAGRSPSVSRKQTLAALSLREKAVYQLIGTGMSYKQIALELNVSHKTVETYVRRICTKFNVYGGRALLLLASGPH